MGNVTDATMCTMVGDLARRQTAAAKACETLVHRALAGTLRRKKLKVHLEQAIFTRVGEGLVVNGSIPMRDNITTRHLRKQAYAVGVVVNTIALIDPITGVGLAPGAALVELRPVPGGDFAFDFLGNDGRVRFSTLAVLTEGSRFESLPADQPLMRSRLHLVDGDITGGSGPDDPLPPGEYYICISFLHWRKCWIVELPTNASRRILV